MKLKSCPFGRNELQSLDCHRGLGEAWQPGLLQMREPFSRMARAASHSSRGQHRDDRNPQEGIWLYSGCSKPQSHWLWRAICLELIGSEVWQIEIMSLRSQGQVHMHLSQLACRRWWGTMGPQLLDTLQLYWQWVPIELAAKKKNDRSRAFNSESFNKHPLEQDYVLPPVRS